MSILNLQLFADSDFNYIASLNTQKTTTAGLSAEMKTYYDMNLINEASASLVHSQFGQKRPIPANGGKTIEFRKFAPLNKALSPIDEGVTPAGNSLTVSTITATVSQYGDYITQSDVLELTSLDNTIIEATKLLGQQAGRTLDTICRNKLMEGTNVMLCPKTVSGSTVECDLRSEMDKTSVITVKALQKAVAILRGQNAPTISGKYVAIIHPYVAYQLMRDSEWRDVHTYSDTSNLYEGEIGEMAGIRFVETTEAKIFGCKELAKGLTSFKVKTANNSASTSIVIKEKVAAASFSTAEAIIINGTANTLTAITVNDDGDSVLTVGTATTVAVGDIVASKGVASDGSAVFATLVVGEGAYGNTEINGGGLQTIIKQKGSAGTGDPLDQRSSVGWKAMTTSEILIPQYMLRIESCVPDFQYTAEN